MDLDEVQHSPGPDERRRDRGPLVDVGEPGQRADARVHDVERSLGERGHCIEHVGLHEF